MPRWGAKEALKQGHDHSALPAGVTANASGSFLINNRFLPPTLDIAVAPPGYDFGNVSVGSAATTLVTISNVGALDLTVSGIGFEAGSSSAIAITQGLALPAVIPPNGTVDIPLTYTPTGPGGDDARWAITSNDPDHSLVEVTFSGQGVQNASHRPSRSPTSWPLSMPRSRTGASSVAGRATPVRVD